MSTLVWDFTGTRYFDAGVDRGVFYPLDGGAGVVWNGLLSVKESSDGVDQTFIYYDGQKVRSSVVIGDFAAQIEAITFPTDLPAEFNLSYRTGLGNDLEGLDYGYRLHLVYNCLATPSTKNYSTIDDASDIAAFSWDISTVPVPIEYARASAHLVIDSTQVNPGVIEEIEARLYGTETGESLFPTVQEVLDIFEVNALFRIIDHGDGSFTATGPDDAVFLTSPTEFVLSWPSVNMISEDTYRASSF